MAGAWCRVRAAPAVDGSGRLPRRTALYGARFDGQHADAADAGADVLRRRARRPRRRHAFLRDPGATPAATLRLATPLPACVSGWECQALSAADCCPGQWLTRVLWARSTTRANGCVLVMVPMASYGPNVTPATVIV